MASESLVSWRQASSFASLYQRMQPLLYAYCRKFISDPETARDLVQDAFIQLWENAEDIHTTIDGYLRKTVQNLCLLHIRRQQIHRRYEDYTALRLKEAELNFFSSEDHPYTSVILKDMEDIIVKCLEKLPPKSRKIFMMNRFENLSCREIAEQLHLSVRTVENHIFRSLAVLKTDLSDYLTVLLLFEFYNN
jgi:RNA polymerase sigma-70 factor (ECF subfamily)